jgi:hypothetical protein
MIVPYVVLDKDREYRRISGVWGQKWLFGGRNGAWILANGYDTLRWIIISGPPPPEPLALLRGLPVVDNPHGQLMERERRRRAKQNR